MNWWKFGLWTLIFGGTFFYYTHSILNSVIYGVVSFLIYLMICKVDISTGMSKGLGWSGSNLYKKALVYILAYTAAGMTIGYFLTDVWTDFKISIIAGITFLALVDNFLGVRR